MLRYVGSAVRQRGTERLFRTGRSRSWAAIAKVALRKLDMLDAAETLNDLRSPPGNRLEPLSGSLAGPHSIRINDQFRICFNWTREGPENVVIVDDH